MLKRANSDGLPAASSISRTSSQPTRGSWVDRPEIPPTRREGWLHKNHRGQEVAKGKLRRWFVSDGFHVEYYESDALHKRMGRFDLRNVIGLGPSADPDVAQGVDLQLSETTKGTVTKTVTVSFEGLEPSEVSAWSTLWASAVSADRVDEAMRTQHRNEVLAHHLDQICWAQGAKMSSVRREMSSGGGGGRRGSSGVLQSPRAPDFAPARRDSYSRKQFTQVQVTSPHPASSGLETPPATPRSSVGSTSSRGVGEPASPVASSPECSANAPPSRTSSLPVGATGPPPASPNAEPPQPRRTTSLPMGSTQSAVCTTASSSEASASASASASAGQRAASATRARGRSFSAAYRRLSLNDVRRLHRQVGCQTGGCQTGGVARVGRHAKRSSTVRPRARSMPALSGGCRGSRGREGGRVRRGGGGGWEGERGRRAPESLARGLLPPRPAAIQNTPPFDRMQADPRRAPRQHCRR